MKSAVRQAETAIKSLEKRISDHERWIKNPSTYPGKIRNINDARAHWRGEIERKFRPQVKLNRNALKQLRKLVDKACRCWYKPWTWF